MKNLRDHSSNNDASSSLKPHQRGFVKVVLRMILVAERVARGTHLFSFELWVSAPVRCKKYLCNGNIKARRDSETIATRTLPPSTWKEWGTTRDSGEDRHYDSLIDNATQRLRALLTSSPFVAGDCTAISLLPSPDHSQMAFVDTNGSPAKE